MKSPKFLFFLLLFPLVVLAQEDARGSVASKTEAAESGEKHALIIGISDYEESDLKLNYANADASLFRDYLLNIVKVDKSRLTYLADTDATSLRITNELRKLSKTAESGDVVYLYFAGHGDVVDDFGQKEGFLLTVDANASQEYYGNTGVVPLRILNLVTNSLTEKGVEVVLILDACRSGFAFEEGAQKNLQTVNSSFERSIKFLSCQPNQLSYESEKLKHGYFTYYLVLGLMGAADNLVQNNKLEYFELQQFLKEQVEGETQNKQGPLVISKNSSDDFGTVDSDIKSQALQSIKNSSGLETALASRGISETEKTLNAKERAVLEPFNSALQAGRYYGTDTSAFEQFAKAERNPELSPDFIEQMRYALVGALSISAQGLINEYISGQEILPKGEVFSEHALYMELCEELIDTDHYMLNSVRISRLFLEAYSTIRQRNYSRYPEAKQKLLKALKIEERAAYIHNALGIIYRFEEKLDSSMYHYKRANDLIPSWSYPVSNLGLVYQDMHRNGLARERYQQALKMNGARSAAYNNLGVISKEEGKLSEAESYFLKSLEVKSNGLVPLKNLGNLYKDRGNLKKAQDYLEQVVSLDPTYVYGLYDLSSLLSDKGIDLTRAEDLLKQAIKQEPYFAMGYARLGDFYRRKSTYREKKELADSLYDRAIEYDPYYEWAYAGKGWLLNSNGDKEKAVASFERGISVNGNSAKMHAYYANFLKNGLKDYDKAREVYEKAIAIDSMYMYAQENLIDLYLKTDQNDLAIQHAKYLLKWNAQAPDIWNLLGDSHFAKAETKEAISAYLEATKRDSTYAKAYVNLSYSLLQEERYAEATEYFRKAVEYNPINNKLETFSGLLRIEARKKSRADNSEEELKLYQLAYDLDPTERSRFDLVKSFYMNDQPDRAYDMLSDIDLQSYAKSWKVRYYELIAKIGLDLRDLKLARDNYNKLNALKNGSGTLLEALIKSGLKGKSLQQDLRNKVNPLYLKDTYLKKNFSKNTITQIKKI